jgi:hypothetical protein
MKYHVDIAELADHFVIVMKEKESGKVKKVFTLNHLGTDILRAYLADKPQDELALLLAERYKAPTERIEQEISRFYKELAAY